VGAYKSGKIDEDRLAEIEENSLPTCGSCSGMFTANSMNCLCEALGIALPGNGTLPAVYSERLRLAKSAGAAVMRLVRENIKPLDILGEIRRGRRYAPFPRKHQAPRYINRKGV